MPKPDTKEHYRTEFYDNPNKKAAMRDMKQGRDHHNAKKCLGMFA